MPGTNEDDPRDVKAPGEVSQSRSELDQEYSDRDRSGSEADQRASDLDQSAAEADQRASDLDQAVSDRDQVASDEGLDLGLAGAHYQRSRTDRERATRERDEATRQRGEAAHERRITSDVRDLTAADRDRNAARRDEAAELRDRLADARDREWDKLGQAHGVGRFGGPGGEELAVAAERDRRRAAEDRARAAAHRAAAARDREAAALDREHAAHERALAGTDELTETLRRGVGLAALGREVERAERTGHPLVVAFVDIDQLKAVNDGRGHVAGDLLLRRVADALRAELRPYDLMLRYGGDEFVCALPGAHTDSVRRRFDTISRQLRLEADGGSFSVGFAELEPGDTVSALVQRADAALRASRGPTGSEAEPPSSSEVRRSQL